MPRRGCSVAAVRPQDRPVTLSRSCSGRFKLPTEKMREGERAGYAPLAEPAGFVVKGRYGPLRKGKLERARAREAKLARSLEA